jgi:hypothetical protein
MWLRLDVDFDESEWIAFLPKLSQFAWVDLLRHVKKLSSRQGKVKLRSVAVWAKAWGYDSPEPLQKMLAAAQKDGAISIEGEDLTVNNWHRYQEPSTNRAEKSRTKVDCNTEQHRATQPNSLQHKPTETLDTIHPDPLPSTPDSTPPTPRKRGSEWKHPNTDEEIVAFTQEVKEYVRERGYHFDPVGFVAHYASKGWVVGKSPLRNWKQACVTFENGWKERNPGFVSKTPLMPKLI